MNKTKTLGLGLALVAATGSAIASTLDYSMQRRNQDDTAVYLGVTGSIYFPTQARFKDAFDSNIVYYGLTAAQNNLDYNWKVRPDIGFFTATSGSNHLFVVPVQASISRKFAQPGSGFQPYAKLGAGVAYFNYRIDEVGGRTSGSKFGACASAEFGAILSQRVRIFAAYDYFAKQDGFDFSGFQIGATLSIFKL